MFQSAPLRGQLHAIVIINLLPVTLGRDDVSAQTHSTNRTGSKHASASTALMEQEVQRVSHSQFHPPGRL